MRVVALEMGFCGGSRRRKGTEFDVPDGTKANWFAPLDAIAKAAPEGQNEPEGEEPKDEEPGQQEPVALSQLGNAPPVPFAQAMEKPKGKGK